MEQVKKTDAGGEDGWEGDPADPASNPDGQGVKVIELKGIQRYYKVGEDVTVRALRGLDFSAEAGEFIAVMGPSGSGKSTLMNILGCLDKPNEGTYWLDGIETSASDSNTFAMIRNEKIGFVFQAFNLLARTSALENVELPLFYRRKRRGEKQFNPRERAAEMLREVGLGERMDHHPAQLSGGQQQRVAIARAMVNDPAFILADEPTGNLDTEMTLEIMSLFQELNNRGKTIIFVTHEPELAAYTKRVITLRDGELISDKVITDRRSAAEDLQTWKKEHSILAGGPAQAAADATATASATAAAAPAPSSRERPPAVLTPPQAAPAVTAAPAKAPPPKPTGLGAALSFARIAAGAAPPPAAPAAAAVTTAPAAPGAGQEFAPRAGEPPAPAARPWEPAPAPEDSALDAPALEKTADFWSDLISSDALASPDAVPAPAAVSRKIIDDEDLPA